MCIFSAKLICLVYESRREAVLLSGTLHSTSLHPTYASATYCIYKALQRTPLYICTHVFYVMPLSVCWTWLWTACGDGFLGASILFRGARGPGARNRTHTVPV